MAIVDWEDEAPKKKRGSIRKVAGYWYNEAHPEYPRPIKNTLTPEEAEEIFFLMRKKEGEDNTKLVRYKGMSRSRITGERLGNSEYQTDEWKWPADLAPHYVLEHKVVLPKAFLDYIGYDKEVKIKIAVDGVKNPTKYSEKELLDCIHNLMGFFDTPIARMKMSSEDCETVRKIGREILKNTGRYGTHY